MEGVEHGLGDAAIDGGEDVVDVEIGVEQSGAQTFHGVDPIVPRLVDVAHGGQAAPCYVCTKSPAGAHYDTAVSAGRPRPALGAVGGAQNGAAALVGQFG